MLLGLSHAFVVDAGNVLFIGNGLADDLLLIILNACLVLLDCLNIVLVQNIQLSLHSLHVALGILNYVACLLVLMR